MKRKAPQFLIRYANDKNGRLYDSAKEAESRGLLNVQMLNEAMRTVNYAVLDYECGLVEIDEAMQKIASINI